MFGLIQPLDGGTLPFERQPRLRGFEPDRRRVDRRTVEGGRKCSAAGPNSFRSIRAAILAPRETRRVGHQTLAAASAADDSLKIVPVCRPAEVGRESQRDGWWHVVRAVGWSGGAPSSTGARSEPVQRAISVVSCAGVTTGVVTSKVGQRRGLAVVACSAVWTRSRNAEGSSGRHGPRPLDRSARGRRRS